MNQASGQDPGQRNYGRKDISSASHLPQGASHIHYKQKDQSDERNVSRKTDPLRNRQIAVAMFSCSLAERFEAFRLTYHFTRGRTGAKTTAQPRVLLNGGHGLIPDGFTRCENAVLPMPFVYKDCREGF